MWMHRLSKWLTTHSIQTWRATKRNKHEHTTLIQNKYLEIQRASLQKMVHINGWGQSSTQQTQHPLSHPRSWCHHHRPRHHSHSTMGSAVGQRTPQQPRLSQCSTESVTKETGQDEENAPEDDLRVDLIPERCFFQYCHWQLVVSHGIVCWFFVIWFSLLESSSFHQSWCLSTDAPWSWDITNVHMFPLVDELNL